MTVVVISSGEKGDRLVGSLEVKVPVAGRVLVKSAQGGEQPDRPQQKRTSEAPKSRPCVKRIAG